MGQIAAYALERAFSSWWLGFVTVVLLVLITGGAIWAFETDMNRMREQAAISRAQLAKAQALWLSECTKPLDECAAAWDDGYTLRSLYRSRVPLDRNKIID
jgi:hypothetical protein